MAKYAALVSSASRGAVTTGERMAANLATGSRPAPAADGAAGEAEVARR
jgi:hypothetical protein